MDTVVDVIVEKILCPILSLHIVRIRKGKGWMSDPKGKICSSRIYRPYVEKGLASGSRRHLHILHALLHALDRILVKWTFHFFGRLAGTVVAFFMSTIPANSFFILEGCVALLALPPDVCTNGLHLTHAQGKRSLSVSGVTFGIFVRFWPTKLVNSVRVRL